MHCPSCGYCSMCGRGSQPYPYPYQPTLPNQILGQDYRHQKSTEAVGNFEPIGQQFGPFIGSLGLGYTKKG